MSKGRIATGILGGSFNPAHHAHRRITLAAIDALRLEEAWWMVSPGNPLKDGSPDMAPFVHRFASARAMARHAPIRVTAIEREMDTRYTADTLVRLVRRFPNRRFIWLMGADNLAQFHRWRDWRRIARTVPIAVIARPGYDSRTQAVRAMGWLRRFVRPASQAQHWTTWRPPALVLLRFRPDPGSATHLRAEDPLWFHAYRQPALRDPVTRRSID